MSVETKRGSVQSAQKYIKQTCTINLKQNANVQNFFISPDKGR